MAQKTSLLGPPEIYGPSPSSSSSSHQADPFMDLMVANYNTAGSSIHCQNPITGFTENYSPTFLSSGNPCLDFFFHVVPGTPPETLTQRLQLAWDFSPLTTLKLICNLRGVRGKGKSDKEGYYAAALWLHKHHPKTLACNLAPIADFGYFKDLPEILYRLLEGADTHKKAKEEHRRKTKSFQFGSCRVGFGSGRRGRRGRAPFIGGNSNESKSTVRKRNKKRDGTSREARILANLKNLEVEKKNASIERQAKMIAKAKKDKGKF